MPFRYRKCAAAVTRDHAETIALLALSFIAADPALMSRFLSDSGLDQGMLRRSVADAALLGGVLDFILADDARVIDFAASAGLRPEDAMGARRALPGGDPGDRGAL